MNSLVPPSDFGGVKLWFVMGSLGGEVDTFYESPREGIPAIVPKICVYPKPAK